MRRRTLPTLALTSLLLATTAVPALAHARLEQKQVPAASEQQLSMRVPGEREGTTNDAVEIQVPADFSDVTCATVTGWTCETSSSSSGTVLTWDRGEDGDPEASLAFSATTPEEPGTYRLPTIQIYSDGSEVAWIQTEEGAERPAPSLTVAEADATVEEDTEAPETDHGDPAVGATEAEPTEETSPVSEGSEPAADAADETTQAPADDAGAEPQVESSSPFLPAILAVVAVGGVAAVLIRRRQAS